MASVEPTANPLQIYSVGHSNQSFEDFIAVLRSADIEVLVDVRSQPYSRFAAHFNIFALKEQMVAAGIKYVFLGRELGGRPEGERFYDDDGHVLYEQVAQSDLFLAGIQRLLDGASRFRVAMMCSEENPIHCHRRLLVGRVLADLGVRIIHLRGDHRAQTEEDFMADVQGTQQLSLFAEEQPSPWKSIRSVSPKKQPPNSSEH